MDRKKTWKINTCIILLARLVYNNFIIIETEPNTILRVLGYGFKCPKQ